MRGATKRGMQLKDSFPPMTEIESWNHRTQLPIKQEMIEEEVSEHKFPIPVKMLLFYLFFQIFITDHKSVKIGGHILLNPNTYNFTS